MLRKKPLRYTTVAGRRGDDDPVIEITKLAVLERSGANIGTLPNRLSGRAMRSSCRGARRHFAVERLLLDQARIAGLPQSVEQVPHPLWLRHTGEHDVDEEARSGPQPTEEAARVLAAAEPEPDEPDATEAPEPAFDQALTSLDRPAAAPFRRRPFLPVTPLAERTPN
jgi:hypothetical protein